MKKTILKRITAVLMLLAVTITASLCETQNVNAASTTYVNIMHKVSTAQPNSPIRYNFSLTKESDIYFIIRINSRTGMTLTVKEPVQETPLVTHSLPASTPTWQYQSSTGIYENTDTMHLSAGNYILELCFEGEVNYDLSMNQISPNAKLNKTKMTITKGFSDTIKVNGGTIKSCRSSNKNIATVTKKGKVSGKKSGTTKIKVTLTNGKTLTCKVTVKPNQYSSKKITISDTLYDTYDMKAYQASFDSNGNLVVKFMIANNSYGKITEVPKFKITVKNGKNKTTASYSKKSYKVSVDSYSAKSYTMTIPKSAFKVNRTKIDLRTSKISITGSQANAEL